MSRRHKNLGLDKRASDVVEHMYGLWEVGRMAGSKRAMAPRGEGPPTEEAPRKGAAVRPPAAAGGGGKGRRSGRYRVAFQPEEEQAADAALTLEDEIALIRGLIQRELSAGAPVKDVLRAVDALGRALKVQYGLEGRAAQGLEDALARALTEIGNELGMTL